MENIAMPAFAILMLCLYYLIKISNTLKSIHTIMYHEFRSKTGVDDDP